MICAILIFLRFCGIFRGVILIVGFFVCFQGKEHRDGDERTVLEQTVFGYGRGELLEALKPYMSDERQRALASFAAIADVLDIMRAK